mmetsp:Transcript_49628/g.165794  ORF Transcript_49628/g.165794 Transcript_49628/m.165794 type:complete len:236 (-) Transcript_49628:218-925(-)
MQTRPGADMPHMRAAVLTASPTRSYWYFRWPMMPAIAEPEWTPICTESGAEPGGRSALTMSMTCTIATASAHVPSARCCGDPSSSGSGRPAATMYVSLTVFFTFWTLKVSVSLSKRSKMDWRSSRIVRGRCEASPMSSASPTTLANRKEHPVCCLAMLRSGPPPPPPSPPPSPPPPSYWSRRCSCAKRWGRTWGGKMFESSALHASASETMAAEDVSACERWCRCASRSSRRRRA